MKKLLTGVCAASMALAVAGTAAADAPNRADFKNAAKYCKALRTSSGSPEAFAAAVKVVVGAEKVTVKNAYGKCVKSQAKNEVTDDKKAHSNAAKDCKAERDADPAAFTTKYGTGKNGKNAYGKCVSSKAAESEQEADDANKDELNAAKACKAEKKASSEQFATDYGSGRNAFGKCVSKKAKAQGDDEQEQEQTATA